MYKGKNRFLELISATTKTTIKWKNECKDTFSPLRKAYLYEIIKHYKWDGIPFSHFDEYKSSCNNYLIYPIICAFHKGYINENVNGLLTFKDDFLEILKNLNNNLIETAKNNINKRCPSFYNFDINKITRKADNKTEQQKKELKIIINNSLIKSIKEELLDKKEFLIDLAKNSNIDDSYEKTRIIQLFINNKYPRKPNSIELLMKQFFVSTLSYSLIRNNLLLPLVGEVPSIKNIDIALSKLFNEPKFLSSENWDPKKLAKIAENIITINNYDIYSRKLEEQAIAIVLTGSKKMENELQNGLSRFYYKIESAKSTSEMLRLLKNLSTGIRFVGLALISDFLKECGFVNYVKIDFHFKKQFPKLIGLKSDANLTYKESFILSQKISNEIGYTPYYIDALLYLWGRYGENKEILIAT